MDVTLGEFDKVYRFIFHIFLALATTQLLWSCAVLDEVMPAAEPQPVENQRASIAMASLNDLENIDAYIKLDNKPLREHIRQSLVAQASATGTFDFSKVRVKFSRQAIALEVSLKFSNNTEEQQSATLLGDVILTFSGNQLIWLPHFHKLKMTAKEFLIEKEVYPETDNELEQQLLRRVNREIADAVIVLGKNVVQINPLPLGNIEVGAALTNFNEVSSSGSHDLGGVFIVAGSAILIERGLTSIALDLEFVPNISACPSDVFVSRSTFTNEIRNREPVGVTRFLDEGETKSHFYTEISGATHPTAVIHYWFADGKPIALEELAVEPSSRWRTWSSKTIDRRLARNWDVIVVEKKTGCILHSKSISTGRTISTEVQPGQQTPAETYEQYKREFERRVEGFSILEDHPDIALIEIPRTFLRDTLHASLKDIQIVVNFVINRLPVQKLSGNLGPFNVDDIICEESVCKIRRECSIGFTRCARQRDNRDCTTCLFRNPLNNRCLNEGTDPICEAAKAAQNANYEAARESCIEQEAIANLDCRRLAVQELRSCEIEAATEQSACEVGRETAREFSNAESFAQVELQLEASGGMSAIFSDMEIEGNLESIRLNLGFSAALTLNINVRFVPEQILGTLTECMNGWQKSFTGIVVIPQLANSMIAVIKPSASALTADWSGYVVPATISPTPLEELFVDNPNMLADCQIGLTVDKVTAAITGENRDYLTGIYPFEIQPSISRINLAHASVSYGKDMYEAAPELSATHLKYKVQD